MSSGVAAIWLAKIKETRNRLRRSAHFCVDGEGASNIKHALFIVALLCLHLSYLSLSWTQTLMIL